MFTSRGQPVLRCAIHTRQSVSRGEQDLTSCDVQRERCEDYVRAMQYEGWVALGERFDDLGVSGGSLERPALRRLLSWCVQGRVDVVVVTSLDRLARKMSDRVRLNDWLKQASVELVILQGAGGARGPLAELVNNVVASLAEFERDIIRERLREAKGRARARGRRAAGRVPLGYRADPNTRQLVVDEDYAALVRAFFERCAAGESGSAIAAWANAAGHRTKVHGGRGGAKWTGRSILQVVHNPICLGRRAHGEGTVEGVHEAIVDEDLARRAFAALDARRTREPSPRTKAPEWDQDPWMLRGLLRCTGCGRVMTTTASAAVTMENADEVPRYYRCRGDAARPACSPPVQVAARHVEARVLTVLREAHISWFRDDRSRGFLEALAPAWAAWQRDDVGARNAMVRGLVWAAEWDRELGLTKLVLDDITVDAFIDEDPVLAERLPGRIP
jgi:DNA invertase Pin-like site-specific DNA recombinase